MALLDRVKERIAKDGPLPFADFMTMALYDPQEGYYAKGPSIGPEGDFATSVMFPSFREAIARLALRAHDALGRPAALRMVELGGGTGLLARSVSEAWRRERPDVALDYVTVEVSPALRARQAAIPGVRSVAHADELAPAPSLVFGNEVLDALPVSRILGTDEGFLEIHVGINPRNGLLTERLLPPSTPALQAYLDRVGVRPVRGQILDLALGLEAFVRSAARLADPGFLVFVDYGDPAPTLFHPSRLNGTLATYKAGGKFHTWSEGVGDRDLTADVDFTTVALAARDAGMQELGLATQQEFLEALGIAELGMPDEVRMVAGSAGLGSAFHVAAFRRGMISPLPGF